MSVGARDTINIDESVHEIYKQLTEGNDAVNAPFKTMKDVFIWAACLGWLKNERRSISGKKTTIFRWAQLGNQNDIPIVKAICLSSSMEINILTDQDKIIEFIEEYANSGIDEIKYFLLRGDSQILFNLVSYINKGLL